MRMRLSVLAFCIFAAGGALRADEPATERTKFAQTFVRQLAAGEFETASERFDATMRRVLQPEKLQQTWEAVLAQQGAFQQVGTVRSENVQAFVAVFVTAEFARGKLDVKVVFDAEDRIAGLFFVPAGQYQPPKYVDRAAFDEEEIRVGKGLLPLSGTLSLPKKGGPFPAILLVHGSGPHDRDETLGPNKPFRDLAHGLASQGIAVLRYEKRTKEHPVAMLLLAGRITVKEETIADAAAAVETLAEHAKIDAKRIFVLGHSLGGAVLPRIAADNARIFGLIGLAASARPLEEIVLDQTKYILALDGITSDQDQEQLTRLQAQVARVQNELTTETRASELPLGIPASYWLDLRANDPLAVAKTLDKPLLLLQGERDYQVTMEDFALWKQALDGRPNVKFVSYPELNHLFIAGRGKSTPAEYSTPGNVAEEVVREIAQWVQAQR